MTAEDRPMSYSISTLLTRNLNEIVGEGDPRAAGREESVSMRLP
jgi:hypothetical protein